MTQEGAPSAVTRARCRDVIARHAQRAAHVDLIHDVKQRAFLRSRTAVWRAGSCFPFASSLHPLGHAAPKRRGPAERREAYYLSCRARRARRHACEAWGVPRKTGTPPLGAPPWRCRPRNRSGPGTISGSGQKAARGQPLLMAGYGPGLFVPRLYGPRSTPLPAPPAGSSPETPLMSEDGDSILHPRIVVNGKVAK
jgi:hypothetical protein